VVEHCYTTQQKVRPKGVNSVCHSMGGLAAREYLRSLDIDDRVEKLITVATPHLGSSWATTAIDLRRSQKIGWFMPVTGWIFAYNNKVLDETFERVKLIDIDGDAISDMEPSSEFLHYLNAADQPESVDYYAIAGKVWWHGLHGKGDGVVSLSSAKGEGVLTLKDEAVISAGHGDVPKAASEGDPSPLLRFIDSTVPVVEITSPDPGADPITEVYAPIITVEGTIDEEYLPADTDFTIKVTIDEDSEVVFEKSYSGRVRPFANSDPAPAGFSEEDVILEDAEELSIDGIYTISVVATNPGGISSDEVITQINAIWGRPIITDEAPPGTTANYRPTIQARIYSPNNSDIDLSSIEFRLDGASVEHIVSPGSGGTDIAVSYTPSADLAAGIHTVVINARDINGLIAEEKNWSFIISTTAPEDARFSYTSYPTSVVSTFDVYESSRIGRYTGELLGKSWRYSISGIDISLDCIQNSGPYPKVFSPSRMLSKELEYHYQRPWMFGLRQSYIDDWVSGSPVAVYDEPPKWNSCLAREPTVSSISLIIDDTHNRINPVSIRFSGDDGLNGNEERINRQSVTSPTITGIVHVEESQTFGYEQRIGSSNDYEFIADPRAYVRFYFVDRDYLPISREVIGLISPIERDGKCLQIGDLRADDSEVQAVTNHQNEIPWGPDGTWKTFSMQKIEGDAEINYIFSHTYFSKEVIGDSSRLNGLIEATYQVAPGRQCTFSIEK